MSTQTRGELFNALLAAGLEYDACERVSDAIDAHVRVCAVRWLLVVWGVILVPTLFSAAVAVWQVLR